MTQPLDSKLSPLSYRDAGVDIEAGNTLVDRIKPHAARTRRPGVMTGLGGFGGLFELPIERYKKPILVSGTDGVGTKLRLAIESGIHNTIGIDNLIFCRNLVKHEVSETIGAPNRLKRRAERGFRHRRPAPDTPPSIETNNTRNLHPDS